MEENLLQELANRLNKVNDIIARLDPTIRLEAFNLLRPYVLNAARSAAPQVVPSASTTEAANPHESTSPESFFARFNTAKPADNVCLAAAFIYYRQGKSPFTLDDLRNLAASVGLPIPDRPDKTLLTTKRDGRSLFRRVGKGAFEPTVHGEIYLRGSYPRSSEDSNERSTDRGPGID